MSQALLASVNRLAKKLEELEAAMRILEEKLKNTDPRPKLGLPKNEKR